MEETSTIEDKTEEKTIKSPDSVTEAKEIVVAETSSKEEVHEVDSSKEISIKEEIKDSLVSIGSDTETSIDSTEQSISEYPIEEEFDATDIEENEGEESDLMDYSIRKGDTFFSIANRFNMKISRLLNVNDLKIRDTLSIGQIIKVNKMDIELPGNNSNEKEVLADNTYNSDIEHKVTSGETMYALAKKYNVSLKEIMEWNNKEDYNLKEGELIVIKEK